MSAMNKALSELADNQNEKRHSIERVHVAPVKQRPILPWVVGTFTLSLAVGGWAISYQEPLDPIEAASSDIVYRGASQQVHDALNPISVPSPTTKILSKTDGMIHVKAPSVTSPQPVFIAARTVEQQAEPVLPTSELELTESDDVASTEPVVVGEVSIEHVELTPEELSIQAQDKAKKALDNSDLKNAIELYSEALRYTPQDTKLRQTLSALYYGKGEVRKSFEILQKGISRDSDNITLRLSLAKLLLKEKQQTTALSVLTPLPSNASVEYLSFRGALAQKSNQDDIALTSYAKLVELEPESGRWWLGLGIQQERRLEFDNAKHAYTMALQGLGVSGQSQQFIRDRLKLIAQLEEQKGES